jgi:hypothetical protein
LVVFSVCFVFIFYGIVLPAFFFLFFLSSVAVAAGPQVAAALAAVVDLVESSLLMGVEIIMSGLLGGWGVPVRLSCRVLSLSWIG